MYSIESLDEIENTADIIDIDVNVTINNYNSSAIITTTTSTVDEKDDNKIETTATTTTRNYDVITIHTNMNTKYRDSIQLFTKADTIQNMNTKI
jgi:citrate lyase gamma subunit